ncbi:hypothetical protein J3R30DRAFT_3700360 [Lentinula aciculospora]|uniref:F-box domain-containing protein n=1 Tax=Lentinula aciculospora TaxID=153920 RepID=A0A9W9AEF2_9AGAR|nr:hypothetical protein J3R30DRAFT_3700360 [Lentinula aciculospora]
MVPILPFDLLLLILEYLPLPGAEVQSKANSICNDLQNSTQNAIYCCSLANREMSRVAGRVLYRSIKLTLQKKVNSTQNGTESSCTNWKSELTSHNDEADVDEFGLPVAPHPLLSALVCHPSNTTYTNVQRLHITGYLSTFPPGSSNQLPELLANAIRLFTCGPQAKLQSLQFTPEDCHPETFVQSLEVLSKIFDASESRSSICLRELHLNHHAFDDENKARLLTQVKGLKKVTLENPTRALLQALVANRDGRDTSSQGWLYHLQTDLVELHLTNNCGSITPGVLHSFIPYLSHLERLTLGISYSLADKDVFVALAKLNKLKSIALRWYLQLNSPPPSVFIEEWPLPALELFQVGYSSRSLQAALSHKNARNYHRSHTHSHIHTRSAFIELDEVSGGSDYAPDPDDACPLCSWVEKVTASSPALQEVIFMDEDKDYDVDEQSDDDEVEEEHEVQTRVAIDRIMWMMRGNMNSVIEEEEEENVEQLQETDSNL